MLTGNPDNFAIWFDAVDEWSTDYFKNGCMAYFIDGRIFYSLNSTLNTDVNLLSSMNCMTHSVENRELYEMPALHAYRKLVEGAFPETDSGAEDSNYTHLITCGSLLDLGLRAFLVEYGEMAKIIWRSDGDKSEAAEVLLKRGEFQEIVADTVKKYENSFHKSS